MSDTVAPERRKPSVALIVSLCVNAALIGLIAIALLRGFGPPQREPGGVLSAHALMRMVPKERDKIQPILQAHRARMRELRAAATEARAASFALLAAKAFDAAAFEKSLVRVQSADAPLEAETMELTADAVAVLTPEERADVAAKLHRPRGSWLKRMFRRH